ncbi:hypothetical protein KC319_g57 [Hortaea werneckii]|nr:hypothetical protein KC319_g57 [Hortaea werneckii]
MEPIKRRRDLLYPSAAAHAGSLHQVNSSSDISCRKALNCSVRLPERLREAVTKQQSLYNKIDNVTEAAQALFCDVDRVAALALVRDQRYHHRLATVVAQGGPIEASSCRQASGLQRRADVGRSVLAIHQRIFGSGCAPTVGSPLHQIGALERPSKPTLLQCSRASSLTEGEIAYEGCSFDVIGRRLNNECFLRRMAPSHSRNDILVNLTDKAASIWCPCRNIRNFKQLISRHPRHDVEANWKVWREQCRTCIRENKQWPCRKRYKQSMEIQTQSMLSSFSPFTRRWNMS